MRGFQRWLPRSSVHVWTAPAAQVIAARAISEVKARTAPSTQRTRRPSRTRSKVKKETTVRTSAPVSESHRKLLSDTLGYDPDHVDNMFNRISGVAVDAEKSISSGRSQGGAGLSPSKEGAKDVTFPSPEERGHSASQPHIEPPPCGLDSAVAPTNAKEVDSEDGSAWPKHVDALFNAAKEGVTSPALRDDGLLLGAVATATPVDIAQRWAHIAVQWVALLKEVKGSEVHWSTLTARSLEVLTMLVGAVSSALAAAAPAGSDPDASALVIVKAAVDAVDALWLQVGVPDVVAHGQEGRDEHLNHRTALSSLNYLLRFQWQQMSRTSQRATADQKQDPVDTANVIGLAGKLWMSEPSLAVPLVRALEKATRCAADITTACPMAPATDRRAANQFRRETIIPLVLMLARTALDVETHLSVARASVCRERWRIPARLDRLPHRTRVAAGSLSADAPRSPLATASRTEDADDDDSEAELPCALSLTDQDAWVGVQALCLNVRITASGVIHKLVLETVTRVTSVCARADDSAATSQQKEAEIRNMRVVVGMVKHALNALLRRHYLETAANDRYTISRGEGATDTAGQIVTVYTYGVHTFLLLHDAQESIEAATRDRQASGKRHRKNALTCGTTLSQALDVAFFLHLYVANRWFGHGSSNAATDVHGGSDSALRVAPLITSARADAYIREVLCDLQHNTAKQLWHLRSKDELFYFSGLRRDGTVTRNDVVRRRQAQSVLGVVHGHVLHPSLLWMPLWQLQELVAILGERPHLLRTDAHDARTEKVSGRQKEATTTTALATEVPAVQKYPVLRVGTRTITLARLHCYLVLRLFVVSNILRACRSTLLDSKSDALDQAGTSVSDRPYRITALSRGAAKRLRASAAHEPAVEPQRRQQRDWAAQTAQLLLTRYPTLAAEVEGVAELDAGQAMALARLESTVRYTLDRGLFIKAADLLQAYHAQRHKDRGTGGGSDVTGGEADGETVDSGLLSELASVQLDVHGEREQKPVSTQSADGDASALPPAPPPLLPPDLILHWSRATVHVPLGFSVSADGCVLRVTDGGPFHRAVETALATAGLAPTILVGWKIQSVNDQDAADGRALARLLRNACELRLRLTRPVAKRPRNITSL